MNEEFSLRLQTVENQVRQDKGLQPIDLLAGKTLLTPAEVAVVLGVRRETIHHWVRQGRFPPPRKFGSGSRWPVEDIRKVQIEGVPEVPQHSPAHQGNGISPTQPPSSGGTAECPHCHAYLRADWMRDHWELVKVVDPPKPKPKKVKPKISPRGEGVKKKKPRATTRK